MSMMNAAAMLDGIRRWVEIESQTADVDGVNEIMTVAAAQFAATGAKVERVPGRNGRGDHLLVNSPWGGDAKGIAVLCHLDTVHPRGTLAKLAFRVEGDRAYGPGIYDMKGGAYIAFAAYAAIATAGQTTPLPIRFIITSDEEVGSPTSRTLIETLGDRSRYVLVTEPARDGGYVVTGRKGVARYVLRAHGRPAHAGGRHQDGRSAIVEMARQVVAIEGMTDYNRGLTFNVGQIGGGTADNVVPEHAWANIDMRVRTMADARALDALLHGLKPFNPDVSLSVTGGLNRPPFEKSADNTALFDLAVTLAREIGYEMRDLFAGGGSDGNFTAHKVATLDGLGVDGAGAHTLEEHLLVSSLEPRMMLLKRLFETLK